MLGKIITIAGCSASGKTYLAEKLTQHYNAEFLPEIPPEGFPVEIVKNWETQSHLFETIVWFRNRQIQSYEKAQELARQGKTVVSDLPFYANQFYVSLYVQDPFERDILYEMGRMDLNNNEHPDCTVYLKATKEDMKHFLKKRRRTWEDENWNTFILGLVPQVEAFMSSIEIPNLVTVQRSDFDFDIPADFKRLIRNIDSYLI